MLRLIKTQQVTDVFRKWLRSEFYPLHSMQAMEFIMENNLPTPQKAWAGGKNIIFLTWFSKAPQPLELTAVIHSSGLLEVYRQWAPDVDSEYTKDNPIPERFLEELDGFRDL